jgi:prepilin-type N-terminal cleavage/methylation domain-containing protein
MQLRKSLTTIGGEKGFTLIELFLVMAIIGILTMVGIGEIVNHRRQAFDRQTIAKAREWLTVATVAVANQELAAIIGATSQGTPPDFPNVDMNPTIHWSYANAGGDVWQFYLASANGNTAFYFWIPGPGCATNVDGAGLSSDQIFEDPTWRAAPIGL